MDITKERDYNELLVRMETLKQRGLLVVVGRAFAIASRQESKDLRKMKVGDRGYRKVNFLDAFTANIANAFRNPVHASTLESEAEKYGLPSALYMSQEDLRRNISGKNLDADYLDLSQLCALCFDGYENSGRLMEETLRESTSEDAESRIKDTLVNWYKKNYTW